jgi:hypothetical protein
LEPLDGIVNAVEVNSYTFHPEDIHNNGLSFYQHGTYLNGKSQRRLVIDVWFPMDEVQLKKREYDSGESSYSSPSCSSTGYRKNGNRRNR